jgi:hypothetical protein
MVVARLVDSWDKEQAGFAAKPDLEALYGLVDALREELEAMGVRLDLLEENSSGRLYGPSLSVERLAAKRQFQHEVLGAATRRPESLV